MQARRMQASLVQDITARFVSLCRGFPPPYVFWRSPEGDLLLAAGTSGSSSPPHAACWREWLRGDIDGEAGIPTVMLSFFSPEHEVTSAWRDFSPIHCYQPAAGMLIREGREHVWGAADAVSLAEGADLAETHGGGRVSGEQVCTGQDSSDRDSGERNATRQDSSEQEAVLRKLEVADWGAEEYRARVEAALAALREEMLEKVVLARECSVRLMFPFDLTRVLSGMLRQPHSFTICYSPDGTRYFLSATPERLGRISHGRFETMALAGTRTGHDTSVVPQDASTDGEGGNGFFSSVPGVDPHAALLADAKERAEHAYVVDMVQAAAETFATDVARTDVRVLDLPHLRHMLTGISGRMRPGFGLSHAIAELHPTPAVAGTPRAEALRLIGALEPFSRGMYAGCIAWFLGEDEGDAAVTIRSALMQGSEALIWAGAGIVRESSAEAEERETRAKLQTMLDILCS